MMGHAHLTSLSPCLSLTFLTILVYPSPTRCYGARVFFVFNLAWFGVCSICSGHSIALIPFPRYRYIVISFSIITFSRCVPPFLLTKPQIRPPRWFSFNWTLYTPSTKSKPSSISSSTYTSRSSCTFPRSHGIPVILRQPPYIQDVRLKCICTIFEA